MEIRFSCGLCATWIDPGRVRAANEITIYGWYPVSKQPCFKYAAVKVKKITGPKRQQPGNVASDLGLGALGTINVGAKALGEAEVSSAACASS